VKEDSSPGASRRELAVLRLWEAYNLLGDEDDSIRMLVELALLGLARRRGAAPADAEATRAPDEG
jgi:hypothetical protein